MVLGVLYGLWVVLANLGVLYGLYVDRRHTVHWAFEIISQYHVFLVQFVFWNQKSI